VITDLGVKKDIAREPPNFAQMMLLDMLVHIRNQEQSPARTSDADKRA
jgi:hypothetical protein